MLWAGPPPPSSSRLYCAVSHLWVGVKGYCRFIIHAFFSRHLPHKQRKERLFDMMAVLESSHPSLTGVTLQLKNEPLWKQFNQHTTEMIITKSGRRMFPSLRLSVSGLEPESRYFLILEARLSEGKRYKFSGGAWSGVGPADPQPHPSTRIYVHPDSPSSGSAWMAQDVLFQKAKLTNNTLDRSGNLVLTSMHKYQPCIHVVKASDILAVDWSPFATFTFPETEFIAVTAYQNEKITELKINYNPFAKAFRENGQARTKRKIQAKQKEAKQEEDNQSDDASSSGDKSEDTMSPIKESRKERNSMPCEAHSMDDITNGHGAKKICIKGEDDSGVSVGSVSPPIEESVVLPPPPPYYPPAFWPFPPYFPYPAFYYPPHFYPPPPPLLDLRPTDYSIKH